MAGNLTRRVPVSGAHDEFDVLAENLNRMLDRIERLMKGMREVTDSVAHDLRTPLNRLRQRLEQIEDTFRALPKAVAALPPQLLGMLIAQCAVPLVLGHKHVAFRDEREIRFVRSRILQPLVPPDGAGYRTVHSSGRAKSVFVLPLRNYPEFPVNADLSAMLDHIIVGPSHQQDQMYSEVRDSLDAEGLTQVRIHRSEIPYRANR